MEYNTVGQLIEALSMCPLDMPIRICQRDGARDGEYWSISDVSKSHLKYQDTSGDPEEYWNDQRTLEKEDRLKEGDTHFKYKGNLILLS